MSQRSIRIAFSLAAAVSLAACGNQALPEQLPYAEPGVEFSLAPSGQDCTLDGAYQATVSWDVPGSITSKVEIQVGEGKRQIFARSNDAVGSEETGDWITEGMTFVLLDRSTETVLAAFKAGPGNCLAAPGSESEEAVH